MTKDETQKITCVGDAVRLARTETAHNLKNWWFRGQSDSKHKLIPSLFRAVNGKFYDEGKLINEFVRLHPEAIDKHQEVTELLTYAQHYGLPTRLLDWSENILVALYFACRSDFNIDGKVFFLPNYVEDVEHFDEYNFDFGKIFIEKLISLNEAEDIGLMLKSSLESVEPHYKDHVSKQVLVNGMTLNELLLKTPFEVTRMARNNGLELTWGKVKHAGFLHLPKRINSRLVSQHGCFTVHTGKIQFCHQYVKINDEFDKLSRGFIIPSECKTHILSELAYCGIYEATLFPELEYQTKHIKSYCLFDKQGN